MPSTASSNHVGSCNISANSLSHKNNGNVEMIQSQAQKIFETALIHSDSYCPTIRADPTMCSTKQPNSQSQEIVHVPSGRNKKTRRSGSSGTVIEFLPPHLQNAMETIEIDLTTPVPKQSIVVSQSVMANDNQDEPHFAHNQVIQPAIRSIIKTKKVRNPFLLLFEPAETTDVISNF